MDISNIANIINYRYQNQSKIQFSGVVSGLDTASIVEKLMEIESQPVIRLTDKYKKLELKQKAYQQVREKLQGFIDFLSTFRLQSTLLAKNVETNSKILTIRASSVALNGTYYVKVLSTATRSSLISGRTIGPDEIDLSTTFGTLNYRYTPLDSSLTVQKGSRNYTVEVKTSDTITDILSKFEEIFGKGNVVFQEGKLKIISDEAFAIRQNSGNFLKVFNLENAPVVQVENNYIMESTVHVGAISLHRTISQIASYRSISVESGELVINGVKISFTTNMTLSQLISTINNSNAGVSVTYDASKDKLVFVSTKTGATTISIDDNGTNLSQLLGLDNAVFSVGNVAQIQISRDGINWQDLYSDSNDFSYEGITISVAETSNEVQKFTVSTDINGMREKIKEFVEKWNEVMNYLYTKLTENEVKGKSEEEMTEEEKLQGLLKNDPLVRRIFENIRAFIYTKVEGDIKLLAELGISTGRFDYQNIKIGKIVLDEDKLMAKVAEDPYKVWQFFGEPNNGFAQKLLSYIREVTRTAGMIDRVAGTSGSINREKRALAKQIENWIERLQKKEQMLWNRFSAMESVLSKLQAQGVWLAQVISARSKNS
nr:flagellar filament capping protein FliD [Pseudothermotoga thermarum]